MGVSFFGLTPETRPQLWTEYFFLVEYGNLSFETIWKMPIYDRRWWVNQLIEKYERQKEATEKAQGKQRSDPKKIAKAHEMISKHRSMSGEKGQ